MEAKLDDLAPAFDLIGLPPADCPVHCCVLMPNAEARRRWPGWPAAATPERGRAACGRGTSRAASRRSGLGEAAELGSAAAWGDEAVIMAAVGEAGGGALTPAALNGLSAEQVAARESWNAGPGGLSDWRPAPVPAGRAIGWMEAVDAATGDALRVPAEAVLIGLREPGDGDAAAVADSNGCAAGPTPGAAMDAALLELIERDATGRWWYGRRLRPRLPLELVGEKDLLRALRARLRETWLLDLTTDLGVPCVAALSAGPDGGRVALGFAAAADPEDAALSAVTEMVQTEHALVAARRLDDPPGHLRKWCEDVSAGLGWIAGGGPGAPPAAFAGSLAARCAERGCRVAFADLTRPGIAIPVWRALSPDLCHYKPRFGRARLLAADPRDLGPAPSAPNPLHLTI